MWNLMDGNCPARGLSLLSTGSPSAVWCLACPISIS